MWATKLKLEDKKGTLTWDSDQYLALAGVGRVLTEVCLDTGTGRSMMDFDTCKALGIEYIQAKGAEFG